MATATTSNTSNDHSKATHLVVLIHGFWGNPGHLKHLRDTLAEAHEDSGLYILTPKSNSDNNTYDGIEVGAERITNEIEQVITELREAGAELSKISLAGYSLGGLLARYVVGLLYSNGTFNDLRPVNFTTFATPHLGVRTPKPGYRVQIWNYLGSKTLSTSGQQIFLVDNFRGTGKQLLSIMAEPRSIFMRGLAMFENRSIYGNTLNDRSVPYYTSLITATDPYVDPDAVDVHPLPDQDYPVILDPTDPVEPKARKADGELTWHERYIFSQRTRESLPFYAILITVLPLAVPLFMLNAGYQTYQSAQRVRLHESGSLIDLKRYRIPLLEKSQALQDEVMERIASERTRLAQESGYVYLPTPPPEPASSSESKDANKSGEVANKTSNSPWPTLALTPEQFEMIKNLDAEVKFTKYPCHIQKVRHTHAAIVVRTQKESFAEGRAVSSHWVKNFKV